MHYIRDEHGRSSSRFPVLKDFFAKHLTTIISSETVRATYLHRAFSKGDLSHCSHVNLGTTAILGAVFLGCVGVVLEGGALVHH